MKIFGIKWYFWAGFFMLRNSSTSNENPDIPANLKPVRTKLKALFAAKNYEGALMYIGDRARLGYWDDDTGTGKEGDWLNFVESKLGFVFPAEFHTWAVKRLVALRTGDADRHAANVRNGLNAGADRFATLKQSP